MSALGWITTGSRMLVASLLRRRAPRPTRTRFAAPALESLERIDLMSAGLSRAAVEHHVARLSRATPAHVMPYTVESAATNAAMPASTTQTSQTQSATVPNTLTPINATFAPPINLFNPALGTLVAVDVTGSATLTSQISAQNTSTTSGANVTGFVQGSYAIKGLDQSITGVLPTQNTPTVSVAAYNGESAFTGPSSVVFAPITATSAPQNPPIHLTAPADLAFFTATAGRTTISPTLVANATAGANAPNANLVTNVATSGSGAVSVTYEYMAVCPPLTNLVRFGIHHQPTTIQLTFGGPLPDAAQASNPAYYTITVPNARGSFTGPGTKTVPVSSAVYDPANNTVTLTTSRQLNVHYIYQLEINLPCDNGTPTIVQFGSKQSLGGFTNPHTGAFVPVVGGVPQYPHGPGPFPK